MELAARVHATSIVRAPLGLLWQSVREIAGVSRREFDEYFAGLDSGVAIWLADVTQFRNPIPLHELRAMLHGFQPPQGFCYLDGADVSRLGIREQRRAA
jgi:predicted transcriptional regulator